MDRRAAAAQLEGVGEAEQPCTSGKAAGAPVAEDHGGQSDVATTVGLTLAVDAGRDLGEERATQTGKRPGDDDGDELHPIDVDAEGLGGDRALTHGAQSQAERSAPQDEVGRRDEQDGDDRQLGDLRRQAGQDAGQVRDEEPVVLLTGWSTSPRRRAR